MEECKHEWEVKFSEFGEKDCWFCWKCDEVTEDEAKVMEK